MIVDSTVLVDLVNGKPEAKSFLLAHETLATSRVNVMELLFGSRSKKELRGFLKQFSALKFEIVEVSESVSKLAGSLLEKHVLSNRLGVADALIAATALVREETLATHNLKHFKPIKGLNLTIPY